MIIKTLVVGSFQVNNYLVIDENSGEAVLIDAGGDFEATKKLAEENKAKIKYILNTHGHMDHIAGDYDIQTKMDAKVFLHQDDEFLIPLMKAHLVEYGMPKYEAPKVDEYVKDGQEIQLGDLSFKVIHTPGHTPGAVSYLIGNVLFSGDTLFKDSVGRTDLPGGSYNQLEKSIKEKLFTLDDNVTAYSGHGPSTTIGYEKKFNPFFGRSAKR